MKPHEQAIQALIRTPSLAWRYPDETVEYLVNTPISTVAAIQRLLQRGWQSEWHPFDVAESLALLLGRVWLQHPSLVEPLQAAHASLIEMGIRAARAQIDTASSGA